jgi:Family of unknown function (DUF6338)
MDVLKEFDSLKVLLWIVPGAFMVLLRSFAMRGAFPSLGKDDLSTLLLGSVTYSFLLTLFGLDLRATDVWTRLSPLTWFFVLLAIPAVIGFLLGLFEVSDIVGRFLRARGIRLPSPHPTAWETVFDEIETNAVLIVTLKDSSPVYGRWVEGSASSTDTKKLDLYIGEIGALNAQGQYVPKQPTRGAYIAAGEIRFIEIITV